MKIDITRFGDAAPRYLETSNHMHKVKCDYCGLYGELGRCEGCGAANAPEKHALDMYKYRHGFMTTCVPTDTFSTCAVMDTFRPSAQYRLR